VTVSPGTIAPPSGSGVPSSSVHASSHVVAVTVKLPATRSGPVAVPSAVQYASVPAPPRSRAAAPPVASAALVSLSMTCTFRGMSPCRAHAKHEFFAPARAEEDLHSHSWKRRQECVGACILILIHSARGRQPSGPPAEASVVELDAEVPHLSVPPREQAVHDVGQLGREHLQRLVAQLRRRHPGH